MNDDAPVLSEKGKFKGPGDPREIGKLGGRPRGSKNKVKPSPVNPLESLSPKKQKYGMLLAKGLTKKEAALRAGYSYSAASAAAGKIETPNFRAAFQELMRSKIPPAKIIRRIKQGMDAVDTKFFAVDGVVKDSKDVINWGERRKASQLAAEMSGVYVPKTELDVTQQVDEGTLRRLADISDRLLENMPSDKLKELEASHVPLTINADE